jgi:hypothetical protein
VSTAIQLYSEAALNCDLPDRQLRRGDIVKVVEEHFTPEGQRGYSVELLNSLGESIGIRAVPAWALESLRPDTVLCSRLAVA